MKILVTGATGMVGRNFLRRPTAENHDILAPSRHSLDYTSFDSIVAYLSENKPDLVIHLAGKVGGIKANMADPFGFFSENIAINYNLIAAAKLSGVRRFLNLGSSCMYPKDAPNPLHESSLLAGRLEPTNEGYALAKIMAQRMCLYISDQYEGLQFKTIIPCNLYGPFDKFDEVNAYLMPAVIRKIHESMTDGADAVSIWGDGTARREFMFVDDLADLMWDACDRFHSLPSVMNAGIGQDYSIFEYYKTVAEVLGYDGGFSFDTTQPSGMAQKLVCSDIANDWGWAPKTSLASGISKTYSYFLQEVIS